MKKLWFSFLVVAGMLAISGFAIGAWLSTFSGASVLVVHSQSPIKYTSYFDTNEVDVLDGSASVSDLLVIENKNNDADILVTWDITRTDDVNDTCTMEDADVDITLTGSTWGELINNTTYLLGSKATENVSINYDVVQWACPQTISVELTLEGTKA